MFYSISIPSGPRIPRASCGTSRHFLHALLAFQGILLFRDVGTLPRHLCIQAQYFAHLSCLRAAAETQRVAYGGCRRILFNEGERPLLTFGP